MIFQNRLRYRKLMYVTDKNNANRDLFQTWPSTVDA